MSCVAVSYCSVRLQSISFRPFPLGMSAYEITVFNVYDYFDECCLFVLCGSYVRRVDPLLVIVDWAEYACVNTVTHSHLASRDLIPPSSSAKDSCRQTSQDFAVVYRFNGSGYYSSLPFSNQYNLFFLQYFSQYSFFNCRGLWSLSSGVRRWVKTRWV